MYDSKSLIRIAGRAYKREGIKYVVRTGIRFILDLSVNYFIFWYHRTFRSSDTFRFRGNLYHYYYHVYGTTWKNERAVEIPIIWDIISKHTDGRILEVGNVLSYRFQVYHDILDKYDNKAGVINEDVIDFKSNSKYSLIVSISTLEHVGWDETPKDPTKILHAFKNLNDLLAPGGQLVVTLPLGYNHEMDKLLVKGDITFDEQFYMKQLGKKRWQEASWEDVREMQYDHSTPSAKAVIIGINKKSAINPSSS